MALQAATSEYADFLREIGRLAEDGEELFRLNALQDELEERESRSEEFLPAAHLREAFGLTRGESLLLDLCISRLESGTALPRIEELPGLLGRLGHPRSAEVSLLFRPGEGSGCLDSLAVDFLLERRPRLPEGVRIEFPQPEKQYHSHSVSAELEQFLQSIAGFPEAFPAAVVLRGEKGSGRHFLISRLAERQGAAVLLPDSETVSDWDGVWIAARIYNCFVCVSGDETQPPLSGLSARFPLLFWVTDALKFDGSAFASVLIRETVPLRKEQRTEAMRELFQGGAPEELEAAGELYQPNMGRLKEAAVRFQGERLCGRSIGAAELLRESESVFPEGSVQRLSSGKRMEDLVLPAPQKRQLCDICAFARARETVYTQWGFDQKIPYGRGITALFYGASGTGKTLAATVIANELGLELCRVDLSRLISKYIGETQKNIGKIFDQAKKCRCILFFDEADALFSRRSDGGEAQDKYVNAEIAYLLQRTEQYDGIILLATNLLQNFDDAFRRRIGFMIHFPLPDADLREMLWKGIFPSQAPQQELDFRLLAEQLELSGAGIRSSAVNAAYLAASQDKTITMGRVVEAARMEYQKEGKSFPPRLDLMYPTERRS